MCLYCLVCLSVYFNPHGAPAEVVLHAIIEPLWGCSPGLFTHTQGWCLRWCTWLTIWSGTWILRCALPGSEAASKSTNILPPGSTLPSNPLQIAGVVERVPMPISWPLSSVSTHKQLWQVLFDIRGGLRALCLLLRVLMATPGQLWLWPDDRVPSTPGSEPCCEQTKPEASLLPNGLG